MATDRQDNGGSGVECCDDLHALIRERAAESADFALAYELASAKSEIARHHSDFERIGELLDHYEDVSQGHVSPACFRMMRAIRNIIG